MSETTNSRRRRFSLKRRSARTGSMTVLEHLGELRKRLMISLAAFAVLSVVGFVFYADILEVLNRPFCSVPERYLGPQGCRLIFTRPLGGFLFRLKVTALVGIALASPIWLYQVWAFIVPGLTSKERRYSMPFAVSAVILFCAGAGLAYYSLDTGLKILIALGGPGLIPYLDAEEYLNFVGLMFLGFGLMFEMPLVLFFLGLVEVVSVEQLRRQRKGALVGIVAMAAIITPSQDPYTMLVLAVPIYGLYELTILLLKVVMRRRAKTQGT